MKPLRLVFLIVYFMLTFPAIASGREVDDIDNYSDSGSYYVFIGEIRKSKLIWSSVPENYDGFTGSRYAVVIDIKKSIGGDDTPKRSLRTEMTILDVESLKKSRILFVFKKDKSWELVYWKQLEDTICLDEDLLNKSGIRSMSSNELNKNCVSL